AVHWDFNSMVISPQNVFVTIGQGGMNLIIVEKFAIIIYICMYVFLFDRILDNMFIRNMMKELESIHEVSG
ncbi:MAG: hypothetical protein Q8835_03670, partial [Sweet potato little leaf phytoplasma]|nr:hypothetical protein [Sweet potato little leaf phytoplasma]